MLVPMAPEAAASIRVGTSGWSYPDWEGRFYPPSQPRGFDELAYLARYFDCIEVDSSFYRPPQARFAEAWLRRTPPTFQFAFKLSQRFTHQREAPWAPAEVDEFRRGIEPVCAAGRLGAVLVQFPWSFKADDEAVRHLDAIRHDFGDLPLVVEVRHISWTSPRMFDYLKRAGLGFCNIDQPASPSGVPPTALVTSSVGYVRLHGRNSQAWFAKDAGRDARYDYLYREDELQEWITRIGEISRAAEKTFVFANNHYRGQAPANALQILAKLHGRRVAVPGTLLETYPFLASIASGDLPPGEQGTLF
jgi:uncharacterized protein YecE (DUF72 family)